ncbi:MAG TPA: HAMP domain-containing sensor histidine kinase [Bryobacteraceae bacterium]|nr:HAMP domain-containing sensor histidine kinase [Bryobacteraceae bacterium]
MRMTSPLPHAACDSALLTSTIAEPEAHLLPQTVSVEREQLPPSCEHCGQRWFLEDNLQTKQKNREFDRIIRGKAELLGMAVHDLRLPVATIQIYSELLAEGIGGMASPELVEWIDSIHSVSEFALRLLDDTLDLAIAESGAEQLHAVPASLAPIVAKSVSMSFPLAARKQMGLTLIQEGEPQPILLDAMKMCKVFNNLIENAIKYSQPGARIEVRISRGEDSVRVSVKDDGPGIGPADLKTLFTPFQRTRARALSEEPSAGLGLSIAKRIVNLHGGRIWLNTETGKGTTFYVSLPTGIPSAAKKS